ncbi:glutathione S-transferase family protein [Sphingobium sp. UBA5915]|uniref:glutathione S-transferase family protein n=1 Tax=Sphingobium sp. UBA5915 TaxID=1947530 RepID=UPI0025EEB16B|nr:glutathione S-transferase family protein [Sphingobium sp. UBA5915]
MKPTITAFECSPDEGQGLARDMRVRWAFEEVGQPYDVRLISMKGLKEPEHRLRNPFGSIPTYEEGDLVLFESGAIILHIAEQHEGLFPNDVNARARVITWLFAALNTVEPPIVEWEMAQYFEKDKSWRDEHKAIIERNIRSRLDDLSKRLGDADWIDGDFSAADILLVLVLRRLDGSGIVEEYSNLAAYVSRGKERAAYKRAFEAQLAVFEAASAS